jgi:predicted MPP superfamily phosphohydrolase
MAEILSHNADFDQVKYVMATGYYALPFLLYLFIFLVFFDMLRGLNHLLKIVPKETTRSRKFRIINLALLLALPAAVVIIGGINFHTIQVNKYRIEIPRQSSGLNQLKIALAADFHLGELTHPGFMEKFAARIKALKPDILLIPGDVVEGDRDDIIMTEFERQFRTVKLKYGIYASLGNHEAHGKRQKLDFFKNAGIKVLEDVVVKIDRSFYLAGRNDIHFTRRRPIAELLEDAPDPLPVILLDHRPIDIEAVSKTRVDIQVSGHTHHGQLFPFNFVTGNIYDISWGYREIGNTHFFVTSGIQAWGPQVKTAGVSEIIIIDVYFKNN